MTAACILLTLLFAVSGCTRFDSSGLGTEATFVDAPPVVDSMAAFDAGADTVQLDSSADDVLPDTFNQDSAPLEDSAPDVRVDARAPFCDSADPNLIACYRFEHLEYPVQPRDESMYAHHGTATKVTYGAGPPGAGKAIVVDATSVVRVPYFATLGVTSAMTIEAWLKVKSIPATGRAGIVDDNGRYGLFLLPTGILQATAPAPLYTTAIISIGTWLHVAYTYDGSKQVIYVSGLPIASQPLAGGTFGFSDGAGLAIGSNSPSGDTLDGSMDSLRIFKVARSPAQICEAAGKSPC